MQFFRQLSASLNQQDSGSNLKQAAKYLRVLGSLMTPLKFVPGVSEFAGSAQDLVEAAAGGVESIAQATEKDIYATRQSIDEILRLQDSHILIVIDDIDRLRPEEVTQIFQLVKAVADFPNTIYLLSFDRKVVSSALNSVQGGSGQEYLEKIIQVSLDIPPPDRGDIHSLLRSQLDTVLGAIPSRWDSTTWGNLYMDGISKVIRTTRDIVRYVNILALTYPVVRDEINPVDFLGVECLRIFAPELYSFVVANPVILTGEADERSETMQAVASGMTYAEAKDVRSFRKAQYTTFQEQVPVQRREGIHGIMARLFPRWAATFQSKDVYGVIEQWRRDRRICHPDFFLNRNPGETYTVPSVRYVGLIGVFF